MPRRRSTLANEGASRTQVFVALAVKISRLTLDQMLWRGEWKITQAALKQLATTEAWHSHAPADTTPRGSTARTAP